MNRRAAIQKAKSKIEDSVIEINNQMNILHSLGVKSAITSFEDRIEFHSFESAQAKKKISSFEFAIMQVADPVQAENHEPFTQDEEFQQRTDKLMNQAKRMSVKRESLTIEQLVTDEAISEVFKNTNFGDRSPRQIISETLKKIEQGYWAGSTANACCVELGLVLNPKPRKYELSITGKKYLELLKEAENEGH